MVLLEEVELLLQAVQVPSEGGDDLLMVRLGLLQGHTVPVHRLAHHQLGLPPEWRAKAHRWMLYSE